MTTPHRPLYTRLTPLALALLALGMGAPILAQASDPAAASSASVRHYDIPAGPLGRTLSLFAAQAGVALSFDPLLTEGKTSNGLTGSFSVPQGFAQLLAGQGLEVIGSGDGYALRAVPRSVPRNQAQAAESMLDEVVITGSRTPEKISEIPGTVWVISESQIAEQTRAGVPLKEALGQLIPGLDVGPQGRTNYGQNMRGRSVLVMIDGVSLNSSRGISRQFDSIDPFNIARIEVLSGASAVYGGGATGGIVNIITKHADGPGLALTTEAGIRTGFSNSDDRDLRLSQSVAGGNDTLTGRLGVSLQQNGGFYDSHGDQILTDTTQTDLQYNRTLDLLGNLDINLDDQSLRLSAQYYDSEYNGDRAIFLGTNFAGALANPALLQMRDGFSSSVVPHTERWMTTADYHLPGVAGGQDFYAQAYLRSEKMDFYPFPGRASLTVAGMPTPVPLTYSGASQQDTDNIGIKLALAKEWERLKLTYGLDADQESFKARQALFDMPAAYASGGLRNVQIGNVGRYPDIDIRTLAAFAQAEWKISPELSLNAGLRQQKSDVDVGDFIDVRPQVAMGYGYGTSADVIPGGSNDYDVTLLNASLLYKLNQQQQTWISYSEGFELPDPAKYYGQGDYTLTGGLAGHWALGNSITVADSPLEGIKTYQVETGWRYGSGPLHTQLAAFYAWSDRVINYNSTTFNISVADQDKRNYGLEAAIAWRFDNGVEAGGNGLLIRSETKGAQGWEKQAIVDASPSKLTAYTGWQGDSTGVRLQAVQVFNLKDASGNELDGYATVDLLASYRFGQAGTVSAGIQNVLGTDYTTIWSQRAQVFYGGLMRPELFDWAGRGRTFSLSYSIDY